MRWLCLPPKLGRDSLRGLVDALRQSDEPVMLRGACAGADLGGDLGDDEAWSSLRELFLALHLGPPTVAVVTGPVKGGGVGLVAACDVVLGADEASFALPELVFGLIPGAIAPALIRRIGGSGVARLALRPDPMPLEEALSAGLVDHHIRDERRVLRHLARLDPDAVRAMRRLLQPTYLQDIDAGIASSRAQLFHAEPRLKKWAQGEAPWSS